MPTKLRVAHVLDRGDPADLRRPGVLFAAADPRARAELAGHLTRQGFAVWTAGTGADAARAYREHAGVIDVVLFDARLLDPPETDWLRTHFPGVPCAVLADGPAAAAGTVISRRLSADEVGDRLWDAVAAGALELVGPAP